MSLLLLFRPRAAAGSVKNGAVAFPVVMSAAHAAQRIRTRTLTQPLVMGATMAGTLRDAIQSGAVAYPLTMQAVFAGGKVGTAPAPGGSGAISHYFPRTDRRQGRTRRGKLRVPMTMDWYASGAIGARLRPAQLRHAMHCTTTLRGEADVPDLAGVLFAALDLFNDDLLVTTDA